jgi:hypothetical protein
LPASEFVGRRVEEVVPNTLMAQVIDSGQPILVDLLTNQAGTFLVSRLPLRDAQGEVIGAIGMVLLDHPETTMQPLMQKFSRLQASWTTRRASWPSSAGPSTRSPASSAAAPRRWRSSARRAAWPDRLHRAAAGRDRHRQGAAGARHPRRQPRAGAALRRRQHRRRARHPAGGRVLRRRPGAYTGADRKGRDGKFKVADGGTLFLDEIGDMPLALQSKLLRVLQEQEVEPLGSNRVERVDVRVIAATSRDLAAMVAAGSFRADLYYRLNVLPIRLPPLRERLADLEALAEALADDIARRSGLPHKLSPEALDCCCARSPGRATSASCATCWSRPALMTDDPGRLQVVVMAFNDG